VLLFPATSTFTEIVVARRQEFETLVISRKASTDELQAHGQETLRLIQAYMRLHTERELFAEFAPLAGFSPKES